MIASIVTLAERPDLIDAMWSMPNTWPVFMRHDPVGDLFFGRLPGMFPECQLLALDDLGAVVGKVHSLPFAWDGSDDDLPDRGWDGILERAFSDHGRGRRPTAVSLIEARLAPDHRGARLGYELIAAARRNVQRLGLSDLFGPVRPAGKSSEPRTPMQEYAARLRTDGLPADAWIRVHVRLGARIVKVCPLSMIVSGTLGDWRAWTGLEFAGFGLLEIPDALAPLHVSVEHDHAVYVEPNVWVHHRLATGPDSWTPSAAHAGSAPGGLPSEPSEVRESRGPGRPTRGELDEPVRDEHSVFAWLLEPTIDRAGIRIEDADHSPDGIFAR